jgi:hypothetical protein
MWLYMFSSSFAIHVRGLVMTVLVYATDTQSSSLIISAVIRIEMTKNFRRFLHWDKKKKARKGTICMWVRVAGFASGWMIERWYRNRKSNNFLSIDIDFPSYPNDRQLYYILIMIRPINKPLGPMICIPWW